MINFNRWYFQVWKWWIYLLYYLFKKYWFPFWERNEMNFLGLRVCIGYDRLKDKTDGPCSHNRTTKLRLTSLIASSIPFPHLLQTTIPYHTIACSLPSQVLSLSIPSFFHSSLRFFYFIFCFLSILLRLRVLGNWFFFFAVDFMAIE